MACFWHWRWWSAGHFRSDGDARFSSAQRRAEGGLKDKLNRGTMDNARWTGELFSAIDAKDTSRFMSFLEPDARFRYGSNPPAIGSDAIRAAVDGFFSAVKALTHQVEHVWALPGHVICAGTVTYLRHDGRSVSIPFCNVLALRNAKVKDYVVYADPAPLFAA
jgi:ketosteroid isomerase-like protein